MPDLDVGSLLGSISVATIVIAIVFSIVGYAAFRYGRKNGESKPLMIGIALMAYGYFVSNPWVSLGIGAALTAFLFIGN